MSRARRVWLLIPVAALCAADVGLTLAGQPAGYWSGMYALADEANWFALPSLTSGPEAFVAFAVCCLAVVAGVVLRSRHSIAVSLAAVVATAHAVGGAGW